tara:strand:- start:910 stop:1668 length:759 start_codon:yes stop_codon:yes gene_type:complete
MVVSKKLKNIKAHFKKFSKNKYTTKNNFPKVRTSMGSVPVPGGQSVNYNRCINMGLVVNCDNSSRVAYCNGSVFRNPLVGYRKTLDTKKCDIKTEEIYKDPYSLSCKLIGGYDRRIRFINNKGGKVDKKYSYSYKDYLKKNCKSFDSHEQRTDIKIEGTITYKCTTDLSSCTTYKNKRNRVVSSSSRLALVKYNALITSQRSNCQNGGYCGFYNQPSEYKTVNTYTKHMDLTNVKPCPRKKMRIGGVMRWSR